MRINRIFLLFLLVSMIFCSCQQAGAAAVEAETEVLSDWVFLGDSTTAHMEKRAPLPKGAQVWATREKYLNLDPKIGQAKVETPNGALTIKEACAEYKPRYLYVTLGVDYGVYYYRDDPQTFRRCYEKLLDLIREGSPDTTVIAGAIFPVAKSSTAITNEMIDNANSVISEIARERNIPYVDHGAALREENGYLSERFLYSEDGIHLNQAAYEVIVENLKTFAKEAGYV